MALVWASMSNVWYIPGSVEVMADATTVYHRAVMARVRVTGQQVTRRGQQRKHMCCYLQTEHRCESVPGGSWANSGQKTSGVGSTTDV